MGNRNVNFKQEEEQSPKPEENLIKENTQTRREKSLNEKNRSKVVGTLFIDVPASGAIETLPKMILSKIFCYLTIEELTSKICLLNKYFFNLLMNKKNLSSQIVWKSLYHQMYLAELNEEELITNMSEIIDLFEMNLNHYYLAIKHYLNFVNIDDEMVEFKKENKKNIFTYKGNKKKKKIKKENKKENKKRK